MEYTNKNIYIEKMIEKYSNMVFRLAMARTKSKEYSEDIYQEVFLRLYKKMPEFRSEEHEKAWLIKVTINCSKNLLGSKFIKNTEPLNEELQFETKEMQDVYYEVLKLPIKYRTIIHLYYYEGYKINEISKILKMNENTVKSRAFKSKRKIKIRDYK